MIKIILLAYLLLINIITYFTYAADKTKARQNKWRIPERTLILLALLGGSPAALLDAIVLAVVSREQEGTYGYKITQDVRKVLNVSESTMYPVLRRLQKDECLEVYDMQFDGRNRRYYKVTEKGMAQLNLYKVELKNYTRKITEMFEGGAAE